MTPDGLQTPDHWKYKATYTKSGKIARFGFEMIVQKTSTQAINIQFGRGSFIADPSSDNSVLLADLKSSLAAKKVPQHSIRVKQLPFEFAVLGENMDRGKDGGLIDAATGNWVATKLFLGPQQESEVFFNFERSGGKGEFSIKDEEYGDDVLKELAKVL